MPHEQRQARQSPANAARPASIAARTAGSSLARASVVAAATCCRHSASAAVAACQAAANCRAGLSGFPAIAPFSHLMSAVTSVAAASVLYPRHGHRLPEAWKGRGRQNSPDGWGHSLRPFCRDEERSAAWHPAHGATRCDARRAVLPGVDHWRTVLSPGHPALPLGRLRGQAAGGRPGRTARPHTASR